MKEEGGQVIGFRNVKALLFTGAFAEERKKKEARRMSLSAKEIVKGLRYFSAFLKGIAGKKKQPYL